jgi:DNA repair protein RecO (recombination protein O)
MPQLAHSFRIEAVVLRHNDWGEADRLLVLYSREMGKLRAVAKGVRKIHSRKAGHLEPFTCVTLQLARGRDLPIVTQADTIMAFLPVRDDLLRTSYAAYIIELVDRFIYEGGENRALYTLLVDTLNRLCGDGPLWQPVRYFEVQILDLLGFRPELFNCVSCREAIKPQEQFFSAAAGGVLCPKCGRERNGVHPVSLEALKYFRHFLRSTYAQAIRAAPAGDVLAELEALLQYYLTYLLERGFNTQSFLREVRQEGYRADQPDGKE